jgi:lipopolysaccharide export LptBFGC system permease protein LptF
MALEQQLIEHLSSEIEAHSNFLTTFRSRIAFAVLVGPFVLLGSFLIGTKGAVSTKPISSSTVLSIVVACVAYLALGVYGGYIDARTTNQCNIWRRQIIRLTSGSTVEPEGLVIQYRFYATYVFGMSVMLVAFLAVAVVLRSVLPG